MHPATERIFRVNGRIPMGDSILLNAVVGAPFGPTLEESLPEIEESTRILRRRHELIILVACLGIFGLATYSTEQRTKEIGIRKVLGSSISSIVFLLTRNYTRWVIVANLFAWPVAYYAVNQWLQTFAYRTTVGISPFILAALITLAVALLSVILQTLKAATANPIHSLRYE